MAVTIEKIEAIEVEMNRFKKRLKAAKERLSDSKDSYRCSLGCAESGALKRAGLDLRGELIKLNQTE